MKKENVLLAIVFLCFIIGNSCSGKHYKNSDQKTVSMIIGTNIPIDSLLIFLTYDRNQVIDVYRGSLENNAKVGLYEFLGNENQLWSIENTEKGYLIRSYLSKKVLAINLKDSSLVQQDFKGSDNQLWIISGKMDSAQILNKALNKYLIIGNDIVLADFNSKITQSWKLKSFHNIQKEMDSCNCNQNFEFIKNRIETSYSGFQDKVNQLTKAEYDKLCIQTEKAVKESNTTISCFKAIRNYISFFQDKHIHFNTTINQGNNNDENVPFYKQSNITNAEWFNLKNIDDSTLLLSLPSFSPEHKSLVGELIDKNKSKLLNTTYLIIDIRGNGGGADETFYSILPFLYTNPFKLYGNDMLASIETIKVFEGYEQRIKSEKNNENLSHYSEWLKTLLSKMKNGQGKFILRTEDFEVKYNKIMKNPRKIGILINRNCASSAEEFLLYARESKKVQLLGEPTSGTLDYSNVISVPCPSLVFKFGYATTRSHRLPCFSIDKDKIQPDVYLTDKTDWIAEAVKQLKR
jgi:hypothetical protein